MRMTMTEAASSHRRQANGMRLRRQHAHILCESRPEHETERLENVAADGVSVSQAGMKCRIYVSCAGERGRGMGRSSYFGPSLVTSSSAWSIGQKRDHQPSRSHNEMLAIDIGLS